MPSSLLWRDPVVRSIRKLMVSNMARCNTALSATLKDGQVVLQLLTWWQHAWRPDFLFLIVGVFSTIFAPDLIIIHRFFTVLASSDQSTIGAAARSESHSFRFLYAFNRNWKLILELCYLVDILVRIRLIHTATNFALTSCVQGLYADFNSILVVKSWRNLSSLLQKHTWLFLNSRLRSLAFEKFDSWFDLVIVNRNPLVPILALAAHQVLTRVVVHQLPLRVLILQLQHQVTGTWLVPPALNI